MWKSWPCLRIYVVLLYGVCSGAHVFFDLNRVQLVLEPLYNTCWSKGSSDRI